MIMNIYFPQDVGVWLHGRWQGKTMQLFILFNIYVGVHGIVFYLMQEVFVKINTW